MEKTVKISELSIRQMIDYEMDSIVQGNPTVDYWPGRTPLVPEEIDGARLQDPEDTLDHGLNCAPINQPVRLGGKK